MGYKAWVGGKSAWVSTKFGTARNAQEASTGSTDGAKYDVTQPHLYTFRRPNGQLISSNSYEEARALAGPGAVLVSAKSKRKRGR